METAELLVRMWSIRHDLPLQWDRVSWDRVVHETRDELAAAAEDEKAALRARMTFYWTRVFFQWSRDIVELGVNMSSPSLLPLGLAVASLSQGQDSRDAASLVPLYRRAASILELADERLFEEAASITDLFGAEWLESLRAAAWQPKDMAYVEVQDEEGFRFERSWNHEGEVPWAKQPRRRT